MGDWFIATEGVKVVKDSASLWPQIITVFTSAGAALGGVCLTHYFARKREERAAVARRDSERLFIATELVFILERFAEGCARIATDKGYTDAQGYTRANESCPEIDLSVVAGDWRSLRPRLMYAIRELPILQKGADRLISATEDPPDYFRSFQERQYQYTRLGLRAIIQARRLRKDAELPATRLDATEWSAQQVLCKKWQQERKRRAQIHILRQRELATFHIMMQQRIQANRHSGEQE